MNAFAKTCRTEFAFLVTKYNFRITVEEGDRDSMASFYRTDALVNVYAEAGSKPWVTVRTSGPAFGLHKAIERIDPDYRKREPEYGETAVLVYYARFLRKHAGADVTVAQADFSLVPQKGASCCYAKSDKYWTLDPQGIAWESFHSLDSVPVYGENRRIPDEASKSACCAPANS